MPIDPLTEELIRPTEATKLYPRGPDGKTVHVSRVYRDMSRGRHGVVLESIRTPKSLRPVVVRRDERPVRPNGDSW